MLSLMGSYLHLVKPTMTGLGRRHRYGRELCCGVVAGRNNQRLFSTSGGSSSASSSSSASLEIHKDTIGDGAAADPPLSNNSHPATPGINVNSLNPALISLFKNPIVQKLWAARQVAKDKKEFSGSDGQEMAGKPPSASRVEVSYPFSTDPLLMETYKNFVGQMRLGRLMEDLDALAGNIAFFHVHDLDKLIVTASVDRIRLRQRPRVDIDQHLSGQVTWTGRSSMEIRMLCTEVTASQEWLEAFVTFVTLDPVTKKPVPVPPLLPQNEYERALYDAGAARSALRRKRRQQSSGGNHDPAVDRLAEQLMQQAAPLISMPSLADPYSILMSQTSLQNALVAQPQVRNLHNRIFGGYLMRVAFELAYANAYLFGGARPYFLEVDEVSFTKPVDVGDLLVFNSRVLYTEPNTAPDYNDSTNSTTRSLIHIQVEAWVTEPEQPSAKMANQYYFTYCVPARVRKVLPANIEEARVAAARILADEDQVTR